MEYETAKTIKRSFEISNSTLQRWANIGIVKCIKMYGGKRLYNKNDIINIINKGKNNNDELPNSTGTENLPKRIIYARVSSSHQKNDLERQIEFLKTIYPSYEIISDIGSGLNYNRQGFKTLLEQCVSGNICEIVVTDKDRICRFGFELFEWIIKKFNVKFVVQFQNQPENIQSELTTEQEMSQDILAICNHFVAKNNGLRSQRNRRERRKIESENF